MKKTNEIANKLDSTVAKKIIEETEKVTNKEFETIEKNIDSTNKVIEKEIDFYKADEFYKSNAKLGDAYKDLANNPHSTEKDKDNIMRIVEANVENREKDREEVNNLKVYEEAEKNRNHTSKIGNIAKWIFSIVGLATVSSISYILGKNSKGANEIVTKATNNLLKK